MKRRVTERRSTRVRAYDVRNDLSQDTLAGLGACALLFNDLQAMLEILLCVCLNIPAPAWRELTTRIGGLEDKTELCQFSLKTLFELSPSLYKSAENTLAAFSQYRGYRDTIIHSRIIDVSQGIAEMTFRRNRLEEVLITEDALNSLYDHMFCLLQEMRELISMMEAVQTLIAIGAGDEVTAYVRLRPRYRARLAAMDEGKPGAIAVDDLNFAFAQDEESTVRELQGAMSRYSFHQNQRKALKPLPSFPPSPPTAQQLATRQEGRGRKRKEAPTQEHS